MQIPLKGDSIVTDVYKAPSADLAEKTIPYAGPGSLEGGIAGDYNFSIGGVMGEAWKRVSGSKGTIWLAMLCFGVVLFIVSLISKKVQTLIGLDIYEGSWMRIAMKAYAVQGVQSCLTIPMSAGLFMIGLKLTVRAPVDVTEIFRHFDKIVPLVVLTLLRLILVGIGFCLFILPGIYLGVAYYLALPLMVEKNLGPWEALEASRKAVTHHWFKFFFTYFSIGLILFFSFLLLGIGVIWTIPMSMLVSGVLYRNVFGYSGEVAATPDPVAISST